MVPVELISQWPAASSCRRHRSGKQRQNNNSNAIWTPKKHPNDSRNTPKRNQNEPKSTKKAITNDRSIREPIQDDAKTVLDRPPADLPSSAASLGAPLGGQNGPKSIPKRSNIEAKIQDEKNNDPRRSWTSLGAILGRFGASSWAKKRLKPFVLSGFVNNHVFDDKTARRRFRGQLGPKKAPA